jgi:luciferase family oxidoreductase group 1
LARTSARPIYLGMRLSVLDQSMIAAGRPPAASIQETLALGPLLEDLGYHRFWLSEHHSSDSIAGSAPEILLAALAARTEKIRLGSAGIMLPHYSSLKIAEQFRVLEALAPGRIDLGVGRAPGSDGRTALALNPNAGSAVDAFPAQLRDLMAWVANQPLPDNHPFRTVQAQPLGPTSPEIWMLGSSLYGAQVAAYFGLPYCYAYFFTEGQGAAEALAMYRDTYRPSAANPHPHSAIAVSALAAETPAEAERLFSSREVWRAERERGRYVPLPSPEDALSYPFTDADRRRNAQIRERAAFGTPDVVLRRLAAIAEDLKVDELVLVTAAHDPAARRRSFELVAEESKKVFFSEEKKQKTFHSSACSNIEAMAGE